MRRWQRESEPYGQGTEGEKGRCAAAKRVVAEPPSALAFGDLGEATSGFFVFHEEWVALGSVCLDSSSRVVPRTSRCKHESGYGKKKHGL